MGKTTFLWQESTRQPYYRIQTADPAVARKLRRRTSCKLSGWGFNIKMWQFTMQFNSPKIAQRSLSRITGQKVREDTDKDVLFSYTLPILTSKSGLPSAK